MLDRHQRRVLNALDVPSYTEKLDTFPFEAVRLIELLTDAIVDIYDTANEANDVPPQLAETINRYAR